MMDFKAVIFDMDGTLLDTLKDLHIALNHSLRACGYGERTREEVQSFIGDGVGLLIARAIPDSLKANDDDSPDRQEKFSSACKAVGEEFRNFYIEHGEDNTYPYDGIVPLLNALKERGIKTAVVSNKVQEAVERLNDRLFSGIFDAQEGDREGVRLKPAPDMLLDALAKLSVDKSEAVYVGDGDADILAASRAGLKCISVCYGYRDEDFLRAHGGKIFARDVGELAKLLNVNL
ncbi:MAG: HAD family hydrolase [Bacteroides sp.]|nr:HAD family hydrolase [Bacillota bacterium]MCM1393681.1 HAD family hydrolase [[Eubacterium] siraeum]MCM1455220.1 HAD family hydrolase [Bacteroides sp.]